MKKVDPNNQTRLKILAAYRSCPGATLRELADDAHASVTTVGHHLANLEAEGLIKRSVYYGKPVKLSAKRLQQRIEMVVAKAMKRESDIQYDVVRHINGTLRLHGTKNFG